jgi:hypothetical protein
MKRIVKLLFQRILMPFFIVFLNTKMNVKFENKKPRTIFRLFEVFNSNLNQMFKFFQTRLEKSVDI